MNIEIHPSLRINFDALPVIDWTPDKLIELMEQQGIQVVEALKEEEHWPTIHEVDGYEAASTAHFFFEDTTFDFEKLDKLKQELYVPDQH